MKKERHKCEALLSKLFLSVQQKSGGIPTKLYSLQTAFIVAKSGLPHVTFTISSSYTSHHVSNMKELRYNSPAENILKQHFVSLSVKIEPCKSSLVWRNVGELHL